MQQETNLHHQQQALLNFLAMFLKMGNLQKVFVVRNLKKLELKQIQDTLDATLKND